MRNVPYGELVAMRAEARQDAGRGERHVGVMPEGFALVDVRDVALDHGNFAGVQRVQDGDRGMRESAGVDDNPGGDDAVFVDRVDDFVFAVALAEVDLKAEFTREASALGFDIRQGLMPVDVRLALAEQVQVGSVQNENGRAHGGSLLPELTI